MKLKPIMITAAALICLSAHNVYADESERVLDGTDAGQQLQDTAGTNGYAASDQARNGEDSSDNNSASFDGQPGGSVQDTDTLQPGGTHVESNSDDGQ